MSLVLCFLLMSLFFMYSFVLSRLWCKKIAMRLLLYIQDNVTLIVFLNKN
ncbi:protein YlcJ [Escherichia coli]